MQAVDYLFGLTPLSFNTAAATVPDAGIVDANSIQPLLFSPAISPYLLLPCSSLLLFSSPLNLFYSVSLLLLLSTLFFP